MGLMPSHRHTREDLEAWERLARYDQALAADPRLDRLADRARAVIVGFANAGPCYCSTSWGRDSVVVAHLVATSGVADRVPLAYASCADVPGRVEQPDSPAVRDAFLARFPGMVYREWRRGLGSLHEATGTDRYVSGVRGSESGQRRAAMRIHGEATGRTCRPIGWWSSLDVWAYLARHDLPVHAAYAMSLGGRLERDRIRVHSIGGEDGSSFGRIEWEDRYYPEETDGLRGWTRGRPGGGTL